MTQVLAAVPRAAVQPELARCARFLRESFANPAITEDVFDEVLASERLLFAHYPQIGSSGLLLERATGMIWDIPSGLRHGRDLYVWAYHRGFRIEDDNVLVVDGVRDREATLAALGSVLRWSVVERELAPSLREPLALHLTWDTLWGMLPALHAADRVGGPFALAVNPETLPANRWSELAR